MLIERIEETSDVLVGIVCVDECLQVFCFQSWEIGGDEKPVGFGVVFEGGLKSAEGAGGWFEVGDDGKLMVALVIVGHREEKLVGQRLDESDEAIEERGTANHEGGLIGAHAGGLSSGQNEGFHA